MKKVIIGLTVCVAAISYSNLCMGQQSIGHVDWSKDYSNRAILFDKKESTLKDNKWEVGAFSNEIMSRELPGERLSSKESGKSAGVQVRVAPSNCCCCCPSPTYENPNIYGLMKPGKKDPGAANNGDKRH